MAINRDDLLYMKKKDKSPKQKLNYLGYIPRDAPQSLHLHLVQTDVAISAKHYTYI